MVHFGTIPTVPYLAMACSSCNIGCLLLVVDVVLAMSPAAVAFPGAPRGVFRLALLHYT